MGKRVGDEVGAGVVGEKDGDGVVGLRVGRSVGVVVGLNVLHQPVALSNPSRGAHIASHAPSLSIQSSLGSLKFLNPMLVPYPAMGAYNISDVNSLPTKRNGLPCILQ